MPSQCLVPQDPLDVGGREKHDRPLEHREHGLPFSPRKEPAHHRLDLGPSEGDTVKALGQLRHRLRPGAPRHFGDQGLGELVVRAPRPLEDIPGPGRAERIVAACAKVALDGLGEGVSCHGVILPNHDRRPLGPVSDRVGGSGLPDAGQ